MRAPPEPAGARGGAPRLAAALACALAAWVHAAPAHAEPVRIVGIEPARTDSTLECTVVTSGLPDARSRETLASGLPSSLTLSIALLDASGRERGGARAEIRVEPDPWERTFDVRAPFARERLADLEALAARLRRLGPVTVAPLHALDLGRPMRLRVRLDVHPLAPAEADRAHALFTGDLGAGGADRREVSAGFGSLLQFFLRRTPAPESGAQATSAPFEVRALPRAR